MTEEEGVEIAHEREEREGVRQMGKEGRGVPVCVRVRVGGYPEWHLSC